MKKQLKDIPLGSIQTQDLLVFITMIISELERRRLIDGIKENRE